MEGANMRINNKTKCQGIQTCAYSGKIVYVNISTAKSYYIHVFSSSSELSASLLTIYRPQSESTVFKMFSHENILDI